MYGELARNWERDAVTVGRVSFLYLRANGPRAGGWSDRSGDVISLKVLVVVRSGPPQTVRISPIDRAAMQYDPAHFNRARSLSDGDAAVRFVPCGPEEGFAQAPRTETQFNGGLITTGPVCVIFEAYEGSELVGTDRVPLTGGAC